MPSSKNSKLMGDRNKLKPQQRRRLVSSFKVFLKFIGKDSEGRVDVSRIFSQECFNYWKETRRVKPSQPEESFRRALTAHCRGSDGRQPFPPEVEAELLRFLRRKERWTCFEKHSASIGIYGFKALGYHEGMRGMASSEPKLKPIRTRKSRSRASQRLQTKPREELRCESITEDEVTEKVLRIAQEPRIPKIEVAGALNSTIQFAKAPISEFKSGICGIKSERGHQNQACRALTRVKEESEELQTFPQDIAGRFDVLMRKRSSSSLDSDLWSETSSISHQNYLFPYADARKWRKLNVIGGHISKHGEIVKQEPIKAISQDDEAYCVELSCLEDMTVSDKVAAPSAFYQTKNNVSPYERHLDTENMDSNEFNMINGYSPDQQSEEFLENLYYNASGEATSLGLVDEYAVYATRNSGQIDAGYDSDSFRLPGGRHC